MEVTGASGCNNTSSPPVDSTRRWTFNIGLSLLTMRQAFALHGLIVMLLGVYRFWYKCKCSTFESASNINTSSSMFCGDITSICGDEKKKIIQHESFHGEWRGLRNRTSYFNVIDIHYGLWFISQTTKCQRQLRLRRFPSDQDQMPFHLVGYSKLLW